MKTTGHNTFTAMVLTAAIAVLLTLSGCTDSSGYKEPEFPSERQLRFEILGEPLTTRDFGDIFTYGDYIIVCGHDSVSGNTFHVFDKASGLKVMESIQFGGDPGRTYMGYTMATLHDGVMSYIDPLDKKETVFNMDGMLSHDIPTVTQFPILLPESNIRTWDLGDRYLFHNNTYTDSLSGTSRLELYDKNRYVMISVSDPHPIDNPYLGECVYASSCGDVSPDGSRAVFGTWRGAILETYDIRDSIRQTSIHRFIEPLVKIILRHNRQHHYEHIEQSRVGFCDIYAGNESIYTAFDGINMVRYVTEEDPLFTRIAVFDWDGRPMELIKTGLSINRLCCDEAEGTVYAIITDTDGRLRLGRLRM